MFERKDWEQLLARSIVPKLAFALQQELAINPLHQELEPFNWVLAWLDVMPLNQASRAGWVGGQPGGWVGSARSGHNVCVSMNACWHAWPWLRCPLLGPRVLSACPFN